MPKKYDYRSEEDLPLYMNAVQVASLLGISKAMAYEVMHSEGFPVVKIGKRYMVSSKKLLEWLEKQTETS